MKHSAAKPVKSISKNPAKKYDPLKLSTGINDQESLPLRAVKSGEGENKKIPIIKRFSPFLILICVMIFLCPYMMITGIGNVHSFWLLLFLFPFMVCNLFFVDYAMWKYFSGKKILPIWVVELTLSILIVKFLV